MVDEAISAVKDVIELLLPHSEKPKYRDLTLRLKTTLGFLIEQKRLTAPIPKDLGDVSDLPEELIRELSVKRTDELEDQILTVMRACDGGKLVTIDQVLVGLYRKFKVVQTRRFIQNKLYRMFKKDLIYPVAGRRAYSLEPQAEAEEPQGGYDEGYGASGYGEPQTVASHGRNDDLDDEIPF